MKFLNKKGQVIDLEITPYGESLLSMGRFKPEYYAFFDDDIIYDATYAGSTEKQNDIQTRIEDTPRVKTQYTFSSREMETRQLVAKVRSNTLDSNEDVYQPTLEKDYSLTGPLGTSMINSNKNPAWSISFYKGSVEAGTAMQSSSSYPSNDKQKIKIPQIVLEPVKFRKSVG